MILELDSAISKWLKIKSLDDFMVDDGYVINLTIPQNPLRSPSYAIGYIGLDFVEIWSHNVMLEASDPEFFEKLESYLLYERI